VISYRSALSLSLLLTLNGCKDDETSRKMTSAEKAASSTQPYVGEVRPASAANLDALIAERGSLTFLSWNGEWIGTDVDTDITFLPGREAHMFRHGFTMIGYRGTYAIDAEGRIELNLRQFEHDWPPMSLLEDDKSLLLVPEDGDTRAGWSFRPIPAEDEAQARKSIAEPGGP
jgi:hypothetical protein